MITPDRTNIRLCPFCSGKAIIDRHIICGELTYNPRCTECSCTLGYFHSLEEAKNKWNERAGTKLMTAEIKVSYPKTVEYWLAKRLKTLRRRELYGQAHKIIIPSDPGTDV